MDLTKKQRKILDHTAHRSADGLFCGDSKDMQVLVRLKLMISVGRVTFCSDEFFTLTSKGREVLMTIKSTIRRW